MLRKWTSESTSRNTTMDEDSKNANMPLETREPRLNVGQNLPNNTISKIFQPDIMRSNLFSKLDSFWKSILVNSTSRQIQPLI